MTKKKARGKRRKTAEPDISAGRTFADKDHPTRWYVVLRVDYVWSLVWWEKGKPKTIPLAHVQSGRVRITSFPFPVSQLLARWGITSKDLDLFMEQHVYRHDPDVIEVRATRRPLTGRTLEVVRQRHRSHMV